MAQSKCRIIKWFSRSCSSHYSNVYVFDVGMHAAQVKICGFLIAIKGFFYKRAQ